MTAIYRKTTEISLTALDNSAAVTLMSTDVERIINGLRMMHEFWANLIQVCVATWLLQQELGVACVAPIAVSIGKFLLQPSVVKITLTDPHLASMIGTFYLSSTAGKKQAEWMKHIQKRVGRLQSFAYLNALQSRSFLGITSTMLSSMKGVKMAGLAQKLTEIIQNLRVAEVMSGYKFRMVLVWNLILGMPLSWKSLRNF